MSLANFAGALLAMVGGALLVAASQAADPAPPTTLLTTPGKVLLADKLDTLPTKGDWRYGPGEWQIVDGVLRGSERAADNHGAVLRRTLKAANAIVAYEFRFDGAKATTLSFNDEKEHVCRALMTPVSFRVQKDDHDHKGPDTAVVFEARKAKLAPGQWHRLVVELYGPEMVATLDDTEVIFGTDALLDREKANFGFTVSGESVSFRNLCVWEATANSSWPTKRAELESQKTAGAAR